LYQFPLGSNAPPLTTFGALGSGKSLRIVCRFGSMRLAGMIPFGNGCLVNGSMILEAG
jgi:hypothetical protein